MRGVWVAFRVIAVVLAVASNVGGQVASAITNDYATRSQGVGWAIMFVTLGLVWAGCAIWTWVLVPRPVAGWAMVACSYLWSVGSWYPVARASGWAWPPIGAATDFWEVFVGAIVLLYPGGRMSSRLDRWIIGGASIAYGIRFLAEMLMFSPTVSSCGCAISNYAIMPYAQVDMITGIGWRVAGGILLIFIAVRIVAKWFSSTLPARRVSFVMPIALLAFAYGALQEVVSYIFGLAIPEALQFVPPIAITAIPLSFVAGVVYTRGMRSRVADLVIVARDRVDRGLWETSLARTLRDPSLRVYWRDESLGEYTTSEGQHVLVPPAPTAARSTLAIGSPDAPLALIEHDNALAEDQRLLDAVSSALLLSVDNDRLRQRLETTLQEVRESRLRIVEASYQARRQIERDLHDGSQQLLVSLAIGLRIATAKADAAEQHELAADLERASLQLADALRELRELARGIHPTVLTDGDLQTAITELGLRSHLSVEVDAELTERLPAVIEETIYFVVAECLTNAAKYANASSCRVRMRRVEKVVLLSVSDDGIGGAVLTEGGGLGGLRDRVEAIDGVLSLHSTAASGTTIEASIPLSSATSVPGAAATAGSVDAPARAEIQSPAPARV